MKTDHLILILAIPVIAGLRYLSSPRILTYTNEPTMLQPTSLPTNHPTTPYPTISFSSIVRTREDIADLLQNENGMEVGAEIGVQQGHFAAHNLNKWTKCKRYYLVDVWKKQQNYDDLANVDNEQQENLLKKTLSRLSAWTSKLEVRRMFSSEASLTIKDGELDFIYFDARHDYCGVSEDLNLYWSKVRDGGIFSGHDYTYGGNHHDQDWTLCANGSHVKGSVKRAVDEFASSYHYDTYIMPGDSHSWMIRKVSTLIKHN